MVTQNVQLFHATVRDNLTFFDDRVSDDRIRQVIDELGLGEWLESLPKGLDTVLESGGGGLSAGEAQLLAFMRIFLQDPGLVILDEASSRLDPATEHLLERAVDRLVQGRTAIIIAHRLGTVQRADEIMILERWPHRRVRRQEPPWPAIRRRSFTGCCRPGWRRCWYEPLATRRSIFRRLGPAHWAAGSRPGSMCCA